MTGVLPKGMFHSFVTKSLEGTPLTFDRFKGKTVLFTNVACACGYTHSNYKALSDLKKTYGDKLEIVGIPSNEFGGQEPGSADDIRKFVNGLGGEKIILLEKSNVNGDNAHPLIQAFKKATGSEQKDIKWNFETKFLVSPDGSTVERHSKAFDATKLTTDIDRYVAMRSEL